jgi:hypothetical protein
MSFAGMNYLAIVIAAVVAWIAGAVWYGALAKHWVAAQGLTMDGFKARLEQRKARFGGYGSYILSFISELIMAWVLAGIIGHLGVGQVTLRNGVISGLFVWLGFVITAMAVNNAFGGRKLMLTAIDGGHWLLVLVVMGAIIGAMGV